MTLQPPLPEPISGWIEQFVGHPLSQAQLEVKGLNGGMEALSVALVTVRYRNGSGEPRLLRYVQKRLGGRGLREAVVHEQVAAKYAAWISPQFYSVEYRDDGSAVLCIEAIRRVTAWPWRDLPVAEELLTRLAALHVGAADAATLIPKWDYETELSAAAEASLAAVTRCRSEPDLSVLAKDIAPVRRIALALPRFRRELLSERPFASAPIHGDLHTGNVLVRRRGRANEPVLLDWGRARLGSPFEDVSSWLQSLGYWERNARRYHDTLLATYLSATGREQRLTSTIRAAYWMAGASNALAGALLHHVEMAADPRQSPARRRAAMRAARDWLRVIRRADAWWS